MAVMCGIKTIDAAANLLCYTIIITDVSPARACELCELLQGAQFIVQMAYCTHNQLASGMYKILTCKVLWLQVIIIHCSPGTLFTTEVEPFVVAASDDSCTKMKRSNLFSLCEEQFYEEVITCFTSEGDYILTNNTIPCKIKFQCSTHAFVMQNYIHYYDAML